MIERAGSPVSKSQEVRSTTTSALLSLVARAPSMFDGGKPCRFCLKIKSGSRSPTRAPRESTAATTMTCGVRSRRSSKNARPTRPSPKSATRAGALALTSANSRQVITPNRTRGTGSSAGYRLDNVVVDYLFARRLLVFTDLSEELVPAGPQLGSDRRLSALRVHLLFLIEVIGLR